MLAFIHFLLYAALSKTLIIRGKIVSMFPIHQASQNIHPVNSTNVTLPVSAQPAASTVASTLTSTANYTSNVQTTLTISPLSNARTFAPALASQPTIVFSPITSQVSHTGCQLTSTVNIQSRVVTIIRIERRFDLRNTDHRAAAVARQPASANPSVANAVFYDSHEQHVKFLCDQTRGKLRRCAVWTLAANSRVEPTGLYLRSPPFYESHERICELRDIILCRCPDQPKAAFYCLRSNGERLSNFSLNPIDMLVLEGCLKEVEAKEAVLYRCTPLSKSLFAMQVNVGLRFRIASVWQYTQAEAFKLHAVKMHSADFQPTDSFFIGKTQVLSQINRKLLGSSFEEDAQWKSLGSQVVRSIHYNSKKLAILTADTLNFLDIEQNFSPDRTQFKVAADQTVADMDDTFIALQMITPVNVAEGTSCVHLQVYPLNSFPTVHSEYRWIKQEISDVIVRIFHSVLIMSHRTSNRKGEVTIVNLAGRSNADYQFHIPGIQRHTFVITPEMMLYLQYQAKLKSLGESYQEELLAVDLKQCFEDAEEEIAAKLFQPPSSERANEVTSMTSQLPLGTWDIPPNAEFEASQKMRTPVHMNLLTGVTLVAGNVARASCCVLM